MSLTSIAFDILMCLLLAAAAAMCWRVDQRFKALREGQDGLTETITALNDGVERARASLAALDRAAKNEGLTLKTQVDQAQKLADELRFLTDQGESLAQSAMRRRRTHIEPGELHPAKPQTPSEQDQATQRRLDALKALR